ncbi:MAG: hypothetical protein ACLP50_24965 [Solirubrobacteraceae bacterium]
MLHEIKLVMGGVLLVWLVGCQLTPLAPLTRVLRWACSMVVVFVLGFSAGTRMNMISGDMLMASVMASVMAIMMMGIRVLLIFRGDRLYD